jgi:hypothetical protein
MYTAERVVQLTFGVAHRHRDMHFPLVLELLGLLLGQMVEETYSYHQRPRGYCLFRMQLLENRSGIRFSGPVFVLCHRNIGKSAAVGGTRDGC